MTAVRVLLLSQFYPPAVGGVEAHVGALARGLAVRGHDVVVATFSAEGEPADTDDGGVRVVRVGGLAQRIGGLHTTERRHAPPVPDPVTVRDLRAIARSFRPDVVHSHNWLGRSFLPVKRESGAAFVVTLHDCGRTCAQGRMMFRGLTLCEGPGATRCADCSRAYYGATKGALTLAGNSAWRGYETRAVDLYLPVSAAIAEANRLDAAGARYEVVPNFVEVPRRSAETRRDDRLIALPDAPFILQVGDLVPDKGVGVLLDAYERLEDPKPPLVLLGRSDALTRELPPHVTVAGPWPRELVAEAWRRSLFGTVPSLCLDASPTVTLEAMAASRPVVASARGGLLDQVADGRTGFLVAPGDAAALADAMARLIGDAALRKRMGASARRRYKSRFSAEVVVDRIESLYGDVTAARSATIGR